MDLAFKSLIDGFNAQINSFNQNNLKIFDVENPEFFITGIEYNKDEDKLVFITTSDPEELKRLEELQKIQ